MFFYNWTEELFNPISPTPLKIKLQSTVRAEELPPPTAIKGSCDPRLRHTGPHKRRLDIQSGRDGHRENLYGNMHEQLKAPNSFSLENGKYQA